MTPYPSPEAVCIFEHRKTPSSGPHHLTDKMGEIQEEEGMATINIYSFPIFQKYLIDHNSRGFLSREALSFKVFSDKWFARDSLIFHAAECAV